jgi:hypothetical protein
MRASNYMYLYFDQSLEDASAHFPCREVRVEKYLSNHTLLQIRTSSLLANAIVMSTR